MGGVTIFWMQLLVSCAVLTLVAAWYVWPSLTRIPRNSALILLLFVHVPRYVGMTELVPGMIDPKLPYGFTSSAAYGDLLEAALALASIFALRSNWRGATRLVWVANAWGFLDLLNGVRGVLQLNVPSFNLATLWYVYTFYAPLVLISHLMIFGVLIKSGSWKKQGVEHRVRKHVRRDGAAIHGHGQRGNDGQMAAQGGSDAVAGVVVASEERRRCPGGI
jgi:hypothetical protein